MEMRVERSKAGRYAKQTSTPLGQNPVALGGLGTSAFGDRKMMFLFINDVSDGIM